MASADDGVRYRDKVTIVTGGAQGIGQACVEVFAKHGSKVVIADIQDDVGRELEGSINKSGVPGTAYYVRCDVRDETEVKKLIETVVSKYGRIDCLINNAATVTKTSMLIDDLTKAQFQDLLSLNILGAFSVTKCAIKHIRETKGNIINIASMTGVHAQSKVLPYCVSKFGIIGFTQTLAIDESTNGVRVNSVSPAGCDTPLYRRVVNELGPNGKKVAEFYGKHSQFMGRILQPEEVGKACLYLATDATYSTGQNLYVSGGSELDYGFKANMEWYFE